MRKGKRFLDKKGKEGKIKRSLLSRVDLLNRFKHWYMGESAYSGVCFVSMRRSRQLP